MDSVPTADPTTAQLGDAVRAALREVYAHPIVVQQGDDVAVLAGKPLERAVAAIDGVYGPDTARRVVALDVATLPWFAVPADGLRLWRQHGRSGTDGEVVTELEAGDPPVQLVVAEGGWQLLRAFDGAQGWIEQAELAAVDAPDGAFDGDVDPDRFVAEVLRFLDAPYVWGGTTDAGVDCSGLVQRAAWRVGRWWLPRHSKALLGVGVRVPRSAIDTGDVLVLKRDPRTVDAERAAQLAALAEAERASGTVPAHGPAVHPMHVAVAISHDEVVHASRDGMRVQRESLESLTARYRVLGVRRLGPTLPKETRS